MIIIIIIKNRMEQEPSLEANRSSASQEIPYIFICKCNQQDATSHKLFIYVKIFYMFKAVPPPIIRSSKTVYTASDTWQTFTTTCHDSGR